MSLTRLVFLFSSIGRWRRWTPCKYFTVLLITHSHMTHVLHLYSTVSSKMSVNVHISHGKIPLMHSEGNCVGNRHIVEKRSKLWKMQQKKNIFCVSDKLVQVIIFSELIRVSLNRDPRGQEDFQVIWAKVDPLWVSVTHPHDLPILIT